jgi:SAM-dependent methyltransferase
VAPESVPDAVEQALALLAAWRPLEALPWAAALAAVPEGAWSPSLRALWRTQLLEPLDESRRARAMPACTPLADATSHAVRAMYEANPYPRWLTLRHPAPHRLGAYIRHWRPELAHEPEATRLLVAGCGSGQQVLQLALAFPEAEVVAFDLSRRSLGYAARMAERHGAAQVRFAQGDLLAYEADEPFHLVSCSGVLHHLADPLAGWRQLRAVLHPDGILKVGVYSTLARRGISVAQALVAGWGHGTDAEGLRRSRQALLALPEGHPARAVFGFVDAYSLSGFRDLVCHVQERSYTLAEVGEALAAVGMRFLGFQLPPGVLAQFTARHGDGSLRDLAAWAAFEEAHPDTFAAMYQFWCAPT